MEDELGLGTSSTLMFLLKCRTSRGSDMFDNFFFGVFGVTELSETKEEI